MQGLSDVRGFAAADMADGAVVVGLQLKSDARKYGRMTHEHGGGEELLVLWWSKLIVNDDRHVLFLQIYLFIFGAK